MLLIFMVSISFFWVLKIFETYVNEIATLSSIQTQLKGKWLETGNSAKRNFLNFLVMCGVTWGGGAVKGNKVKKVFLGTDTECTLT